MARGSYVSDFTRGSVMKQLIIFSLPLFLSNLLQIVYNMVDMVIVGRSLGKVGLSAVSVGGAISMPSSETGTKFAVTSMSNESASIDIVGGGTMSSTNRAR